MKGKIALVTGASRGIGKAAAELLAKEGATVVVNYQSSKDEAEAVAKSLGNDSIAVKANVSDSSDVKEMFAQIKEKFGKLDILVNNAGILKQSLLLMSRESDYDDIMNTNVKGTFLCLQAATKMMMKQKFGRVVNLSSIVGVQGNEGQTAYSASKSAIIGLTRSAAKELGKYNITVNAVAPGFIDTDMTKDLTDELKDKLVSNTSIGRMGTAQDVANAIVFLCKEESEFISGQILGVDGAQIM